MKLFQIEEPDGAPLDAEGPGAAVGIGLDATGGAVAVAVGGNAEILPGADGARHLARTGAFDEASLVETLLALRSRAEKQLQRPVTHAVVAVAGGKHSHSSIAAAGSAAGLVILRVIDGAALEKAALDAAIVAEDAAPSAA